MLSQDEQWLLKEKYDGKETPEFAADQKRLASSEPLGYVIGYVPFLNCRIYLDSHPLIPRPETEYWTEKAIQEIKTFHSNERFDDDESQVKVLDLCAGSGAIGVAVAKAVPATHVTFAELDKNHLATIAKNLDENDISCTRYQVFQSDLFANLEGQFDFILTNPPYIDPALDRTETSVKDFEPHVALYGGAHGLELIERIITEASQYLTASGVLYIEHEPEQSAAISELATQHDFTATVHQDQYGVERYSRLLR